MTIGELTSMKQAESSLATATVNVSLGVQARKNTRAPRWWHGALALNHQRSLDEQFSFQGGFQHEHAMTVICCDIMGNDRDYQHLCPGVFQSLFS